MQQLTGLDTAFLNMETATTFGHVAGLAIFDPSATGGRVDLGQLDDLIRSRLHLVPPLRRRLVEVPFGLDQPYWIEDPDFDLDYHLRHIALPAPGNDQQLAEQVARLSARPLDRRKPLWELYLIEGLEGGRVAQYTKIHHAAVDGVSGAELLTTLLDVTPEPREVPPPEVPWQAEAVPTDVELMGRSMLKLGMQPTRALRFQMDLVRRLGTRARAGDLSKVALLPIVANLGQLALPLMTGVLERLAPETSTEGELLEKPPSSAPRTPFNSSITAHRRYAFGSLSLDDVKAVKNACGATVNDVVMAICARMLRRWLIEHDALPEEPLLAMVPVSVRTEAEQGSMGNKVSTIICVLPTDESDPLRALEKVHQSMASAKDQHAAVPASVLQDFAEFTTPAIAARAARAVTRTGIVDRIKPPFNVVISNVPGPSFPLYSVGAKLLGSYPVSAIADGAGLNITVQSYQGHLDFGLLACREQVPDVWRMITWLGEALDELKAAAGVDVAS